jgi:uncharacterized protein (DUF1778 family)
VAGFAAAVYHRGVAVIHVPTSLLGQVDAAIGGKTGVNLPEVKNLVGAFWQPAAVICDIETLETLPPREYRSGLGEMAKYAFLGVEGLRDMALEDAVAACVACKAAVVGGDEREAGGRALLNYGHTLAHALETAGAYDQVRRVGSWRKTARSERRAEPDQKARVRAVARLVNQSITSFMLTAALERADEVVANSSTSTLSAEFLDEQLAAPDAPTQRNEALSYVIRPHRAAWKPQPA